MNHHTETAEYIKGFINFNKSNKKPNQTQVARCFFCSEEMLFDQRSFVFDPQKLEPLELGEALLMITPKQVDTHPRHSKMRENDRSIKQDLVVGCGDHEITQVYKRVSKIVW